MASEYFDIATSLDFRAPLRYFVEPSRRVFYLYLFTSVAVAYLILRRSRKDFSLLKFFFPKSSRVDWSYYVTNTIIYPLIVGPFFFTFGMTSALIYSALGPVESSPVPAPLWGTVFYSMIIILLMDFGIFLTHLIQHKIPMLWEFHKVHHSAEELSPITVYRMHPVDDILTISITSLLMGIGDGLFRSFLFPAVTDITIFGINAVLFLFYVGAYHLRHSGVWLDYGPFWDKIFISPAQHQIHHSRESRHIDKNFGFIFSFWDTLADSLYLPQGREEFRLGISEPDAVNLQSVRGLYFHPFRRVWERFRR